MRIVQGEKLINMAGALCSASSGKMFMPRNGVESIRQFISKNASNRVCVLHGLRRTGKTVMMLQACMGIMKGRQDKCAYILVNQSDNIEDLSEKIEDLKDQGVENVFLDEVTSLSGFPDYANIFPDTLSPQGLNIVMTGSESLNFSLSRNSTLYDRADFIHTTWMSMLEYARLFGKRSIDDYVENGGIFSAGDRKILEAYPDDAIARNMAQSLWNCSRGKHLGKLLDLHQDGLLLTAINNVFNDDNHRFIIDVIRDGELHDLKMASQKVAGKNEGKLLRKLGKEMITAHALERLSWKRKELMIGRITKEHVRQLNEFLELMKVVIPYPVISLQDFDSDDFDVLIDSQNYHEYALVQPGLRWIQSEVIINELEKSLLLNRDRIDIKGLNMDKYENLARNVISMIRNNSRGRILESVAFTHLKNLFRDDHAFCFRNPDSEIDIVFWRKPGKFWLLEVKNDTRPKPDHGKHLKNEDIMKKVSKRLGTCKGRYVLYRGPTRLDGKIKHVNMAKFLIDAESLGALPECHQPWGPK